MEKDTSIYKLEGKLAFVEGRKLIVVGDLNGDYKSYLETKRFLEKGYLLLYLGDYADRGYFGVEIIEDLIKSIEKYPDKVLPMKGHRESYDENGLPNFSPCIPAYFPCNLMYEVETKRGNWKDYYEKTLKDFFNSLPLSAIHEKMKIFFVHGGISSAIKSIEDLKYPSSEIEEDLLWSDPIEGYGETYSRRGVGVNFGQDVTEEFCRLFNVEKIVRSHQSIKGVKALSSPFYEHKDRVITISSTRVFGGKPHILKIENGKIEVIYL